MVVREGVVVAKKEFSVVAAAFFRFHYGGPGHAVRYAAGRVVQLNGGRRVSEIRRHRRLHLHGHRVVHGYCCRLGFSGVGTIVVSDVFGRYFP